MDWLKRRHTIKTQDSAHPNNSAPLSPPPTPKKLAFTVSFPTHLPSIAPAQIATSLSSSPTAQSPITATFPVQPSASPFSPTSNAPVVDLSPFSSRITGTLNVHNNT